MLVMDSILAFWWFGNNFGDMLTPYLIERISGRRAVWVPNEEAEGTFYLVAGSVLGSNPKNAIVWGTGILSADQKVGQAKEFCAVRGPSPVRRS